MVWTDRHGPTNDHEYTREQEQPQRMTAGLPAILILMRRPEGMTDQAKAAWAKEHLLYEVQTMLGALTALEGKPRGMEMNIALESFAVHARNLLEFLWYKPNPRYGNDAFASDFSDEWNGRRGSRPPRLKEVDDGCRFGKEIFHLTYDRIGGDDERKRWLCSEMAIELAVALDRFATIARPTAIDEETRGMLRALLVKIPGANDPTDRLVRAGAGSSVASAQATGMVPTQVTGGTVNTRSFRTDD